MVAFFTVFINEEFTHKGFWRLHCPSHPALPPDSLELDASHLLATRNLAEDLVAVGAHTDAHIRHSLLYQLRQQRRDLP